MNSNSAQGEPPRLWIVRHGETTWARLGRHTSHTDVHLTAHGRADGRSVGRRLEGQVFALVLSSPMSRALDTARLAGFGDRVEVTDDLREWDYGADEGRTTPEIRADRPGWAIWRDGPNDGETARDVATRVDASLKRASRVRTSAG